MAGGRPTKYSKRILEKAREYLKTYEDHGDVVPHVEGIAEMCGVSTATIYNWAGDHPEFLETLQLCKSKQARALINKGLTGAFQPTIVKLMLANHGYREKSDHVLTGNGGGPVEFTLAMGNEIASDSVEED